MAVRIEDAGFEIRDMIAWVYGSGFPKSLDVSKAIDKAAGAEREVVGSKVTGKARTDEGWKGGQQEVDITAPSTPEAKQWSGWGTALKPALEPITVARKPFKGTVAANVLEHGTGAINVDECRVHYDTASDDTRRKPVATTGWCLSGSPTSGSMDDSALQGRWPANLIHDGSEEVVELFPGEATGSAARFFYCAKASKRDRDEGCDHLPEHQEGLQLPRGKCPGCGTWKNAGEAQCKCGGQWEMTSNPPPKARNNHPTVKPTELMRYLCRLVTPPGGIVLDPFMGSGSTGKAAMLEGFQFIGIERDEEYMKIAEARIKAQKCD